MTKAIASRPDDSSLGNTVVGNYFSDDQARRESSVILGKFTRLQVKNASGPRGMDAAKKWIEGKSAPNLASTINLARALPAFREWLLDKIGHRAAQVMSADAVIRWAREHRRAVGLEGDIARAVLRAVAGDEPEPAPQAEVVSIHDARKARENFRIIGSEPSTYTPDGADGDLLERRRA